MKRHKEDIALDIYFQKEYGIINELIEDGTSRIFECNTENGKVSNLFILREIPEKIEGVQYYDIVSPYGYGGPVIMDCRDGDKALLLECYERQFEQYCKENNIVSEFVRFHPIVGNGVDFQRIYNSECIRQTVGTNLRDFDNPEQEEFSKSCRKRIRKALRHGITYRVTKSPEDLHSFKGIYYATMKRNEAKDYYYFSDTYFEQCLRSFREHILLVEAVYEDKVIAAGFYFVWDKIIHIHLSGTLSEYLYLSPEYILQYAVTLWGKENGYELIHHGGGRSNALDDSLYTFKKQFGEKTSFDFYVGRKVWNQEVYDELCRLKHVAKDGEYFPAYREGSG